ncbi:MAG: OadG family protein [Campylobacterales bacterium]|nr:OadG family protein [Campylobacterales bacterium]
MEVNLVAEGLKFMVLGMGIVFLFLTLMILAMNVMSKIIHRYFPEPHAAESGKSALAAADKLKKVAAIAAAIHHHNTK